MMNEWAERLKNKHKNQLGKGYLWEEVSDQQFQLHQGNQVSLGLKASISFYLGEDLMIIKW